MFPVGQLVSSFPLQVRCAKFSRTAPFASNSSPRPIWRRAVTAFDWMAKPAPSSSSWGRPLEDHDLPPARFERDGRSQSADAGTHDHHPVVAHVRSSRRPGTLTTDASD